MANRDEFETDQLIDLGETMLPSRLGIYGVPQLMVPHPSAGRILIVEDEPSLKGMMKHFLTEEGFTVALAGNGEEALKILGAKEFFPDLIIMDIMMPKVDGRKAITILKHSEEYRRIPILAMSAGVNLKLLSFEDCQPDALLPKPFDLDALLAQILHLFKTH